MGDFEKLSVSKPFGPSIGELNVKEEFVNDLNEYCKIVFNEEGRAEKLDVGKELAGQVKQEFEIDVNFFNLKINNYLTNMIKDYLWKSLEKKTKSYQDFSNKIKVIYKNKWIVRQFESEYNPLHFHTGSMSGVCYILLPKDFGKKSQSQKRNNPNGCIALAHGSPQFNSPAIKLVTPEVGKFILFPNYLLHTVYPFKGPGERRSFSFNADVIIEK